VTTPNEIILVLKQLEKRLKKKEKEPYIELLYKLEKTEKGFIIRHNDFVPFGLLPELELSSIFKVLYFSAIHSELSNDKSSSGDIKPDGVVFPIEIFSHRKTVETHIVRLVQEKVIANRDLTAKEVIEQTICDINKLLEGVSLKTELVDINLEQPVFKSFCGSMILSNELSGGEKQLYYKAILFDKLRPQNSLIMVDEPETSLHPTWQQEVLKLYNNIQGNNQVILVTHSPHIIASIHPDNLFVLNINEEKKTVECFNAREKGFYTKGNEPNDILDAVMGTPLRDLDTKKRIDEVFELLRSQPDKIDEPKNKIIIDSLIDDLGGSDPLIMRIIHKLSIIQYQPKASLMSFTVKPISLKKLTWILKHSIILSPKRKIKSVLSSHIKNKANYYLALAAPTEENLTDIIDVTDDLNPIFKTLSEPLQKLVWS